MINLSRYTHGPRCNFAVCLVVQEQGDLPALDYNTIILHVGKICLLPTVKFPVKSNYYYWTFDLVNVSLVNVSLVKNLKLVKDFPAYQQLSVYYIDCRPSRCEG